MHCILDASGDEPLSIMPLEQDRHALQGTPEVLKVVQPSFNVARQIVHDVKQTSVDCPCRI
eukprot:6620643-Alexandrium_andersonii.AAC.1